MYRNRSHYRRLLEIPLLLALVALLAGCATQFAEDAGDPCATERAELRGAQNYFTTSIIKGAVVGGILGALTGALLSDSDQGKGALIGGAAGAIAGAIGGYYLAKQNLASDAAALNNSILKDVVADNTEIDKATLAFAKLRNCRFTAARQVKSEFAARRISRAQAISRLDELKARFNQDLVIADEIGTKMADRSREFGYASEQLVATEPEAKRYLASYPITAVEPGATPTKRKTTKPKATPAYKAPPPKTTAKTTRPPAKAPPPKAAPVVAVAQETNTNQIKQKKFADEVAVAKTEGETAFSLVEGKVSVIVPPCLVCDNT